MYINKIPLSSTQIYTDTPPALVQTLLLSVPLVWSLLLSELLLASLCVRRFLVMLSYMHFTNSFTSCISLYFIGFCVTICAEIRQCKLCCANTMFQQSVTVVRYPNELTGWRDTFPPVSLSRQLLIMRIEVNQTCIDFWVARWGGAWNSAISVLPLLLCDALTFVGVTPPHV